MVLYVSTVICSSNVWSMCDIHGRFHNGVFYHGVYLWRYIWRLPVCLMVQFSYFWIERRSFLLTWCKCRLSCNSYGIHFILVRKNLLIQFSMTKIHIIFQSILQILHYSLALLDYFVSHRYHDYWPLPIAVLLSLNILLHIFINLSYFEAYSNSNYKNVYVFVSC